MVVLSNDAFLSQLSALFSASVTKGTVHITVKRALTSDPATPCALYRACNSRRKISTYVPHSDVSRFLSGMTAVQRGAFTALKKTKKPAKKRTS